MSLICPELRKERYPTIGEAVDIELDWERRYNRPHPVAVSTTSIRARKARDFHLGAGCFRAFIAEDGVVSSARGVDGGGAYVEGKGN